MKMLNRQGVPMPAILLVFLSVICCSCRKDVININDAAGLSAVTAASSNNILTPTGTVNSTWTVNWNNYADGAYALVNAQADFGNIGGWVNKRAAVSNHSLRIGLLPHAVDSAGGIIANAEIESGSEYELDYDVRFHSQFYWGRGGKLGFGFRLGDGNTGGVPAWEGKGGSIRIIWYQTTAGRVCFQPYVYYKDQPSTSGDNFGVSYPQNGTLYKGKWYHVHMYVKSNSGSNKDGHATVVINNTVVLDTDIRWTTHDSKRLIHSLTCQTFRGGNTSDWATSSVGYIYYDNLKVHRING